MIKHTNGNGVTLEFPKDVLEIKNVIDFLNLNKVSNISIVDRDGEISKDSSALNMYSLEFLNELKYPEEITEFHLYCDSEDYSPIYRFVNLEKLYVDIKGEKLIDLSKFTKLKKLSTRRLSPFSNLDKCPALWLNYGDGDKKIDCEIELLLQLKQLVDLRLFKIKNFKLDELSGFKKLKQLWFTLCDIETLHGIKELQSLEFISVGHCNKFVQVDEIEQLPKLKAVWFDACSKLKYMSAIGKVKNLKILVMENIKVQDFSFLEDMDCKETFKCLMLDNCGNIPSIKFLDNYPNMEAFAGFNNTNIIDGDITPCLRLESASVTNKKHYNLKDKELPFGRGIFEWFEED